MTTLSGQVPQQSAESQQNLVNGVKTAIIIFEVLSLVALALRVLARKLAGTYFGWDDWLALLAGVFSIGNLANDIVLIGLGAGNHIQSINPEDVQSFFKSVFVGQVLYAPTIATIKLAILFVYLRLFNPNRTFCKCVYVLITLTVMWGVAVTIATILQCVPIAAAWDHDLAEHATCIDLPHFLMGYNVADIFIDIAILVLPAPIIWGLKIPTSKKIAILSIFLLAAFDLIMAIIRLASLATFNVNDPTFGFTQPMLWSTIEINVGIVCACLPVMTPIFQKLFGNWVSSWSSRGASNKSGGRQVTVKDIGVPSNFRRMGDEEDGMSRMAGMQKGEIEMMPSRSQAPVVIRPKSGVPF